MWKVIGASVTGTSHQAAGRPCEDASGWLVDHGAACLAVADGAGSRPMSRHGAALAVDRALVLARAWTSGQVPGDPVWWLGMIFQDVRDQIAAVAAAEGTSAGDYATTLAVTLLAADTVTIGQIGDTIAVVGRGGRYETVAPAAHGEYVNETTFITEPGALDQARITAYPAAEVDAVFLSTDGLRFKVLDNLAAGTPFTPFFEDLAAYVRSPRASEDAVGKFLTGVDDQSGDDKTLVAAVRSPAGPESDAMVRS
jgi:serine/threonine protein phosphatase PrpC